MIMIIIIIKIMERVGVAIVTLILAKSLPLMVNRKLLPLKI